MDFLSNLHQQDQFFDPSTQLNLYKNQSDSHRLPMDHLRDKKWQKKPHRYSL